jgi:uncharacterized protein
MNFPARETVTRAGAALALCAAISLFASGSAPITEAIAATADSAAIVRTISVSGQGEAKGTPDQAHLSAGVVTEGKTAAEALSANSRAMNDVFATLKRLGIPEKNIQTSNFNVSPQYPPYNSNGPQPPRRIIGYQVTNTVYVTVDGIDNVGPALDALVRSGANESSGISFGIKDPKPLEETARRDAVEEAMAKARTLADAAGVHLGRILSINEGGGYAPPIPMMARDIANAGVSALPTPVAAGEATVLVNVSIVYEIQ